MPKHIVIYSRLRMPNGCMWGPGSLHVLFLLSNPIPAIARNTSDGSNTKTAVARAAGGQKKDPRVAFDSKFSALSDGVVEHKMAGKWKIYTVLPPFLEASTFFSVGVVGHF